MKRLTASELEDLACAWHAPECNVDAGGGCILDYEIKDAFKAGYQARDDDVEQLIGALVRLIRAGANGSKEFDTEARYVERTVLIGV